jgi:hypothetical protein
MPAHALMRDGELAVCPGRDDYKYVYMAASTDRGSAFPFQSIVKVDTCVPVERHHHDLHWPGA